MTDSQGGATWTRETRQARKASSRGRGTRRAHTARETRRAHTTDSQGGAA